MDEIHTPQVLVLDFAQSPTNVIAHLSFLPSRSIVIQIEIYTFEMSMECDPRVRGD